MNERHIKRTLEDNGLLVADVARMMRDDFPDITEKSADTMIRDLISGRRWFPVYAKWFNRKFKRFGLEIEKPAWIRSVRERMKIAA